MGLKQYSITLGLTIAVCLVFLYLSQRQLAGPWIQFALNSEMNDLLVEAMHSQRKLADLDPENEKTYKELFFKAQSMLAHLEVLQVNREKITDRYNLILVFLSGSVLSVFALAQVWRRRLLGVRLHGLQQALERLATGEVIGPEPIRHNDLIGKIETMIRDTSRMMIKTRTRLKYLENLAVWQEFSRGIAHEIRTPLTTIRLELKKIVREGLKPGERNKDDLLKHERGLLDELSHLSRFTDQYTSFAKIGKPNKRPERFSEFLVAYTELYEEAWPGLQLSLGNLADETVALDRRLIRQVLVNLCKNSARALAGREGRITFSAERERNRVIVKVRDTGPGIVPKIRDRLFEPYVSEGDGGGLGLGLAISKKIMLDHGGDLDLSPESADGDATMGAEFRLFFPMTETAQSPGSTRG